MPGHLLHTIARRRSYLDQIPNGLRFETVRVETFRSCCPTASPQEHIGQLTRRAPPVHEEEFLLQSYPADREPGASLIRQITPRESPWQGPILSAGTGDVRGVYEHLYLPPSSGRSPRRTRRASGKVASPGASPNASSRPETGRPGPGCNRS